MDTFVYRLRFAWHWQHMCTVRKYHLD